ncbi:MAG TPA: hypothetical protein VK969_07700 [Acidimicrobiia bacterium]|nr:hypothetical protein [Acidimicrobiia bacterium]
MTDPERTDEGRRPIGRLGWLVLAISLPLAGAYLLWWIPGSRTQTLWVSLVVFALALTGWHFWRED